MITVIVPTFDEFNKYAFIGNVEVQIKDNPNWEDINAIGKHLPGIPQGGIPREPLKDLITKGFKAVREFYDTRQNTKKLKGYFVTVKDFKG